MSHHAIDLEFSYNCTCHIHGYKIAGENLKLMGYFCLELWIFTLVKLDACESLVLSHIWEWYLQHLDEVKQQFKWCVQLIFDHNSTALQLGEIEVWLFTIYFICWKTIWFTTVSISTCKLQLNHWVAIH